MRTVNTLRFLRHIQENHLNSFLSPKRQLRQHLALQGRKGPVEITVKGALIYITLASNMIKCHTVHLSPGSIS